MLLAHAHAYTQTYAHRHTHMYVFFCFRWASGRHATRKHGSRLAQLENGPGDARLSSGSTEIMCACVHEGVMRDSQNRWAHYAKTRTCFNVNPSSTDRPGLESRLSSHHSGRERSRKIALARRDDRAINVRFTDLGLEIKTYEFRQSIISNCAILVSSNRSLSEKSFLLQERIDVYVCMHCLYSTQ